MNKYHKRQTKKAGNRECKDYASRKRSYGNIKLIIRKIQPSEQSLNDKTKKIASQLNLPHFIVS